MVVSCCWEKSERAVGILDLQLHYVRCSTCPHRRCRYHSHHRRQEPMVPIGKCPNKVPKKGARGLN